MLKCSFDEFVGEKVVSPSYSSSILGLPLNVETLMPKVTALESEAFGGFAEDGRGIRQGDHFLPNKFIKRTFER